MLQKLLVPITFLGAQLLISWYGYHTGKMSIKGSFLGMEYNSLFTSALITQIKFIWLIILVNLLFVLGFHWGANSYKSFVVIIMIWFGSGPIAALIFNAIVAKAPIDLALILGVILLTSGAVMIIAHQDIMEWLG